MLQKVMYFASVAEFGTGVALMVVPHLVVALLLGAEVSAVGISISRCFGIGLIALGLACWPGASVQASSPAVRAMLVYNALTGVFLAYLGFFGKTGALLLWPVAGLHAAIALLLVSTWRKTRT